MCKKCIGKRDTTNTGHYNSKTKQGFAIWTFFLSLSLAHTHTVLRCGRENQHTLLVFSRILTKRPDVVAKNFSPARQGCSSSSKNSSSTAARTATAAATRTTAAAAALPPGVIVKIHFLPLSSPLPGDRLARSLFICTERKRNV